MSEDKILPIVTMGKSEIDKLVHDLLLPALRHARSDERLARIGKKPKFTRYIEKFCHFLFQTIASDPTDNASRSMYVFDMDNMRSIVMYKLLSFDVKFSDVLCRRIPDIDGGYAVCILMDDSSYHLINVTCHD